MKGKGFFVTFKYLLYLIGFLWLVFFLGIFTPITNLGIVPRHIHGLPGIIFSPFIHGSLSHLTANTAVLLAITGFLIYLEGGKTFFIMAGTAILGGAGTWIIGRGNSVHIGASGVIYGVLGYLLSAGIFRRDFRSIAVSILVFLVYGGLIFGVLPSDSFVSWESHLCGFLSGIVLSSYNNKK
jgi:membrane associated rhomboid family serine protease